MKLYLISQSVNNEWDTYDSAVVCAIDEKRAKQIHPEYTPEKPTSDCSVLENCWKRCWDTWAETPEDVSVKYIGEAAEGSQEGVILASFNAG